MLLTLHTSSCMQDGKAERNSLQLARVAVPASTQFIAKQVSLLTARPRQISEAALGRADSRVHCVGTSIPLEVLAALPQSCDFLCLVRRDVSPLLQVLQLLLYALQTMTAPGRHSQEI